MRGALVATVLRPVAAPEDPALAGLAHLLAGTFADPDVVLGLDRLQNFVAEPPSAPPSRLFHVLVATESRGLGTQSPEGPVGTKSPQNPWGVGYPEHVIGGVVFSYVPETNCAFSEYIVVAPQARGQGLARRLFDARRATLDQDARQSGHPACRGLFVEVENPQRTPAAIQAQERQAALEAEDRLRFFAHLGFRRTGLHYVQPPLAEGKSPVTYLDLLFLPWDADAAQCAQIPAAWVLDTVRQIWSRWSPHSWRPEHDRLRHAVAAGPIPLLLLQP